MSVKAKEWISSPVYPCQVDLEQFSNKEDVDFEQLQLFSS